MNLASNSFQLLEGFPWIVFNIRLITLTSILSFWFANFFFILEINSSFSISLNADSVNSLFFNSKIWILCSFFNFCFSVSNRFSFLYLFLKYLKNKYPKRTIKTMVTPKIIVWSNDTFSSCSSSVIRCWLINCFCLSFSTRYLSFISNKCLLFLLWPPNISEFLSFASFK